MRDYLGDGSENQPGFADTVQSGRSWMIVFAVVVIVTALYSVIDLHKDGEGDSEVRKVP